MVLAAATAEAWIEAGSTVGVAGAHAAPTNSAEADMANRRAFMLFCLSPGVRALRRIEARTRLRAVSV
jgi:hypothetical protein